MSDSNGNGKAPHGGSTRVKLERLRAHHEQLAAALSMALAVLDADEHATKAKRAPGIIADALAIEHARTNGTRPPRTSDYSRTKHATRQQTAALLARFSPDTPTAAKGTGRGNVATLVRHGYLKRTRGGLVRTAKPFTV